MSVRINVLSDTKSINSQGNCVLKEDYAFLNADPTGNIQGEEHGLFLRDTRFLSHYAWDFGVSLQMLYGRSFQLNRYDFHYASMSGVTQLLGFRRKLSISAEGILDEVQIQNTSMEELDLSLQLAWVYDFSDLFRVRGFPTPPIGSAWTEKSEAGSYVYSYASEFIRCSCSMKLSGFTSYAEGTANAVLRMGPGQIHNLTVQVTLSHDSGAGYRGVTLPSYGEWKSSFQGQIPKQYEAVLDRAIGDLRGLLLSTPQGLYPAAGIPWYVAAFGRDALITAYLTLPWRPELAAGTLRFLARYQGTRRVEQTFEAPGKIFHELRYGELTAAGITPYGPQYGSIDSTALFIILLHKYLHCTGDSALVRELRTNWEAALAWHLEDGDVDGDGFTEHPGDDPVRGHMVQSWKDSDDSMSHADGSLAEGWIAPCEVQGYRYSAFLAAGEFYALLGEPEAGAIWTQRAEELRERFDGVYWLENLSCYAMALDGTKQPLAVLSSNAGQLFWSGIVKKERVSKLVSTLFSNALYSGWGIRTLGSGEGRYNPVSYHNGSVWPHDSALIALGLFQYGYKAEAYAIRDDLFDLAAQEPDRRLPELVAGYQRESHAAVSFPIACRPQAWDAAVIIALSRLFQ